MTQESGARFSLALAVSVAVALAILCGLGSWQLQRLKWKEALLAGIARAEAAQPVALEPLLDDVAFGRDEEYRRVKVTCPGLARAPALELYALREGQVGSRLISACHVVTGYYNSILVDRGFISDQVSARPPVDPADRAPLHLVGVLRAPDRPSFVTPKNDLAGNHWYSRDVAAMAKALGATRPGPLILMAETSSNPDWPALKALPLPAEIPNRHLEYALTWFGLAAALACVYAASLWKWWKA